MTVFEWQAAATENIARNVAHWLSKTQADKVDWCAKADDSSNTRSAMDVVKECIMVNHRIAALLTGTAPGDSEPAAPTNAAEAGEQLKATARALANVIRGLDESVLGRLFETPFGSMPGAVIISIPATNMAYHGGQINYIQRLYGDIEFTFPPAE